MIHHDKKHYEMFARVRDFGRANAADFPASSVGGKAFAEVEAAVAELEEMGVHRHPPGSGSEVLRLHLNKAEARQDLRESLRAMARAARAMAYESGGLEHKFRMPRGDNDQKLYAAARAFAADAPAFKDRFLEYGLAENFIGHLNDLIEAFNQSVKDANAGSPTDSGAISAAAPIVGNAVNVVRKLDVIVRNKYSRAPAKLADWLVASHVER